MAVSGKGQQITGLLLAWRRRRRSGNPLIKQRVGDATPILVDDWLFSADAGGAGVTVTLSVTDAADTLAATALVEVGAALAVTDTADTLAAAAVLPVVANTSATDAADSLASGAGVAIVATASNSDAADTLAAAALVAIAANASTTDTADTLAGGALVVVAASLSVSDVPDTLDSDATVTQAVGPVLCDLDVTDQADALDSVCKVDQAAQEHGHGGRNWRLFDTPTRRVIAALSVTDDADTLLAGAIVGQVLAAGLSVQDDADLLRAAVSMAWPEAVLVIDAARLRRAPVVQLVKSKYEAVA